LPLVLLAAVLPAAFFDLHRRRSTSN